MYSTLWNLLTFPLRKQERGRRKASCGREMVTRSGSWAKIAYHKFIQEFSKVVAHVPRKLCRCVL
jgi:hypothetical protein